MRKPLVALVAASLALTVVSAPPALAGKKKKPPAPVTRTVTFEESGSMTAPGPSGAVLFGVTEGEFVQVNTCASLPASQGFDGWVVELPEEFRLGTGTVTITGADASGAHDMDAYFYDGGCTLMGEVSLTEGADPAGAIPPGATWVVVDLFSGAGATFDLKATATITE